MAALVLALGSHLLLSAPSYAAPAPQPMRSVAPATPPSVRPSSSPVRPSPAPAVPEAEDEEILKNLDFFAYMDAAEHQDMPGVSDEEEEEPDD